MGLAASQSRLLLLTARKSDLEYRAQMICQRKIMLAMQTEDLARGYSTALSNRKLMFTYTNNSNEGETINETLTYAGLTSTANANFIGNFRIVKQNGVVVVPNEGSLPQGSQRRPDGLYVSPQGEVYDVDRNILNTVAFQNGLRSGFLLIQKDAGTDCADWKTQSISGLSCVRDVLNTEDDPMAEAEYQSNTLVIQNQDKMMDLELKQVETQQKACENEIDSVKKIIDKSIERGFKTFA